MKLSEILLAYMRPFMHYARTHVKIRRESGNQRLMISVSGPRITGRQSLISALTLSGPGDLFKGILKIMRHLSPQVTGLKLNSSSEARESSVDWRVTEKSQIHVCIFPHCGFQCTNND